MTVWSWDRTVAPWQYSCTTSRVGNANRGRAGNHTVDSAVSNSRLFNVWLSAEQRAQLIFPSSSPTFKLITPQARELPPSPSPHVRTCCCRLSKFHPQPETTHWPRLFSWGRLGWVWTPCDCVGVLLIVFVVCTTCRSWPSITVRPRSCAVGAFTEFCVIC